MGKLKERYFPEGMTTKEYCELIRDENIKQMQESYASYVSLVHLDTVKKYDMTQMEAIMFGWHLCLAYQYGSFDDYENSEWFEEFKIKNLLYSPQQSE